MTPRSTVVWAFIGILLLVAAAVAFNPSMPPTLTVQHHVPVTVIGIGTVEADRIANIGFEIGGTIAAINVRVNEQVAGGALLATLDRSRRVAERDRARASLAAAEVRVTRMDAEVQSNTSEVELRRRTSSRNLALSKRGAVSVSAAEDTQIKEDIAAADLQAARRALEIAKAQVTEWRAAVNVHSVDLEKQILRAPFDAIVTAKLHEQGEAVSAGNGVFTLIDPLSVWVLAYIDEAQSGSIRIGQPAEIRLRSRPQAARSGRVARIDLENDRVTEERRVYVAFDRIPTQFNLGEQAEVEIQTGRIENAILIPERLVLTDGRNSALIWTLDQGRIVRRKVRLGQRLSDGLVELATRLPEGVGVLAEEPPPPWYAILGFGGERL